MLLEAVNAHREEPENEPAFGTSHRPRILLDGNLDEDWGDCLYLQPVLSTMVSRRTILWRSPFCPQKMKLLRSSTSWL